MMHKSSAAPSFESELMRTGIEARKAELELVKRARVWV